MTSKRNIERRLESLEEDEDPDQRGLASIIMDESALEEDEDPNQPETIAGILAAVQEDDDA